MQKIRKISSGFIEKDLPWNYAGSFGRYDKGKEAIFEPYKNGDEDPPRFIFFISFLDRVANAKTKIDEDKLFSIARSIVESYSDKKIKTKKLFFLYNFLSQEFDLIE